MTSVLSGISGQFGKALILGTFFPAIIFVVLWRVLVQPYLAPAWQGIESVKGLDTTHEVFVLLFVAIVLSGLLCFLYIPLTMLVEGYPWECRSAPLLSPRADII
ncbi:MAG: hypothetical protein ACRDJW_18525 [Thermomicrobiales bacterium]